MKHGFYHLRWLVFRFRRALILYAASWAALMAAVWLVPPSFEFSDYFIVPHAGLLLFACLILLKALWQDPAPGTDSFWRTRPSRWRSLCLSQMSFILLFLAGPPGLCWIGNGLILHETAVQWWYGSFDLLFIVCPLLALAGIVSFSRGWYSLLPAIMLGTICFLGGFVLLTWSATSVSGKLEQAEIRQCYLGLLIAAPSLILAGSWAAGMWRSALQRRAVVTELALILLPALIWTAWRPVAETVEIEAFATVPGVPLQPGDQAEGVLTLRGVPQGTRAFIDEGHFQLVMLQTIQASELRSFAADEWHGWEPDVDSSAFDDWDGGGPASIGRSVRAMLPSGTHWYADALSNDAIPACKLDYGYPPVHGPVIAMLSGDVRGVILRAATLVSVAMKSGAVAAEKGMRIRIANVRMNTETVSIEMELWRSASAGLPSPPEGVPDYCRTMFALYFPAVPMAVLLTPFERERKFRSWQCVPGIHKLGIRMPEAEAIRGVKFTPESVQGAQLFVISPVGLERFTVRYPKGEQTFPAISEEDELTVLLRVQERDRKFDAARRLERIRQLGAKHLRTVLTYPWGKNIPDAFTPFWREWLSDEYLPDLAEAIRRDHRWTMIAWQAGLADKLGDTALGMLRRTRAPLPVGIVAAAAGKAERNDYEALRHHAVVAEPVRAPAGSSLPLEVSHTLWRRLRALPDFDWRGAALQRWQQSLASNEEDFLVAPFAALAGDAAALNAALEDRRIGEGMMWTPEEFAVLSGMIDGIPSDAEQQLVWMLKHRGHFSWDAARERYEVKP